MNALQSKERDFLKKILSYNVFPEINSKDFTISSVVKQTFNEYTSKITIFAVLDSKVYFRMQDVYYNRFSLSDYKVKTTDPSLIIEADKVSSVDELIDYMNEIYLNTSVVGQKVKDFLLTKGIQIRLKKENLEPFRLENPQAGDNLTIFAVDNSYIFEGSLLIEFI